ncbi:MAG: SIS domain-containing protein, partial [Planctomycetota bacterium]
RLDGETPADPARPASRGQIVVLDAARAGRPEGVRRIAYDGTDLPPRPADFKESEITTRDVHRGDYTHFLRKEIAEAPESIRKTLRGRLVEEEGGLAVRLGEESLPGDLRRRLADGSIRRLVVVGQGTAAVAGSGVALSLRTALAASPVAVEVMPATELSGFHLRDDMGDTLVVAISQSGTTTDTNRTVDLVRARGGAVVGIVNRRQSDLTERVDGVLYTSDGRDVEMSVASTKAFYSQIAAGILLAEAIAHVCGQGDAARRAALLRSLRELPRAMAGILGREEAIARIAAAAAPPRRHWAVVGNGANRIAAEEIRIKLSELCYKSIACDATEDKKHIDLSSEPFILVCAAGLRGSTAGDVAKEVAIYAAHNACPVVIATEGGERFPAAAATIPVPEMHPDLAFIGSTMAGHLFGYHAALAIDRLARPLREARAAIEVGTLRRAPGADARDALRPLLVEPFARYSTGLRQGRYDGTLEPRTAAQLSLLFRYASRSLPLDDFGADFGRPGTPDTAVDELTQVLTRGIEELTRPIDAIKHQAKTVTVGISRADEALLGVPLVRAVFEAGAPREGFAWRDLRLLQVLDPAIEECQGHTLYSIERGDGHERVRVVGRGGVAAGMTSRTDRDPRLRGTKHTVAVERRVLVAVGRKDRRPILLVPEVREGLCTGIVLLHVRFRDPLDAQTARAVLTGYRNRYSLIVDAVNETDTEWSDAALERLPILDLLTRPVLVLADQL